MQEASQNQQGVPLEDVEVVGEKVNYKVALNPEIFYRYNVRSDLRSRVYVG